MKNFFLWVFVYIPAFLNIAGYTLYFTGSLDSLYAKYDINIEEEMEQCLIK